MGEGGTTVGRINLKMSGKGLFHGPKETEKQKNGQSRHLFKKKEKREYKQKRMKRGGPEQIHQGLGEGGARGTSGTAVL